MTVHEAQPPSARPIDTLLAGYAAGTLNAPLHVLVGAHLALCERSLNFVSALERVAEAELLTPVPLAIGSSERMLSAILREDAAPARPDAASDPIFPPPLRRLIGRGSDAVPWRFKLPGIKEYRVSDSEAGEAVLYWVKAGRRLPQHTHEGEEVTLLLQGGFTDPLGHYRRGDIAIADSDLDHTPVADADEDCICFAVTDAPLQLTGPVMRLLRKVFHH